MIFKNLHDFVGNTTCAKRCVSNVAKVLKENGFIELDEKEHWEKPDDVKGVYVIRGGSLIAVKMTKKLKGFFGVLTHTDSPHFKIKINPEMIQNCYIKLNVEPYGGSIYYSWLDKPLSICGTLIDKSGRQVEVDTGLDYQVFIPSQAIHINREVNASNSINPQKDMLPVAGLGNEECFFEKMKAIAGLQDDILAYDLSLYNPEPVKTVKWGYSNIAMGPRLDNLSSVYSAMEAFVAEGAEVIDNYASVLVAFNSEEIGSATFEGADGTFLISVLERICKMYGVEKYAAFASSKFLSIDAAHALHPNAPEKSDPTNIVKFDGGVVIKHNANYANDIELEAHIKKICNKRNIKVQDFYARSDMHCGSTLGNINMSHLGIRTLDIGIPMLGMHSAVETISMNDVLELECLIYYYYKAY